ncbi:MAG: hypothetical protein JWO38_3853 [Gemmataceae bacterium]|nr:hypothetical protein [Gemmataceae bacterium]
MTGPTLADLAAAVRAPAAAFADPTLRAADPVLGAGGLPLAYPGDRAVVFQLCPPGAGHGWAVKCYPAADPALADRYARVAELVGRGRLPFAVPCRFLERGLQARGQTAPVAVLDWVEGVPLDRAVRDRAADPVAIHQLFQGWIRVAAGLRAAGAAHGELSHANVLVVPGADPIRLVDYDSFHLPGLPPAADAGHPDFRHPAGADPADRDRFPLLVVATALRAVEVLGRGVWDRYAAGGGLLFTAADFRDPAASPLLRDLTSSPDPLLRTLAAAVAGACGRPAAETPWADDLCPRPDDEDLPSGPADDEDLPFGLAADDPPAAPPRKPRPRRRSVALAVLASVLLAGAAAVGLRTGAGSRPAETADAGAHPPQAEPPAAGQPAPPIASPPKPAPAVSQLAPKAVGFRQVWAVGLADDRPVLSVHLTRDGRTVLAQRSDRIETFDAKSGATVATLRGPGLPTEAARVWSFAPTETAGALPFPPDEDERVRSFSPDEVWVYGHPLPAPTAWQVRTGTRLNDPIKGILAPPGPRGSGPDWCTFSPDGRYVFAANYGKIEKIDRFTADNGKTSHPVHYPAPYRLSEVGQKQPAKSGAFLGGRGSARFSGDRVLVAGATGEVEWFQAWDGHTEVGWRFPSGNGAVSDRLSGLSADGSLAVLWIEFPGKPPGYYLTDARTGQPLRELGPVFTPGRTVLTDDGRWVVGLVSGPDRPQAAIQVTDARTGVVLVHTPLAIGPGDIGTTAVSNDGRVLAVHIPGRKELVYYALRDDVPSVPDETPIPPPAAPFPETSTPWFAPVESRPGLRSALPDVPIIQPRWMVKTPAALQALARPQAPLYTPDGKTLVLSGGAAGTVLTFDAKTGAAGPVFDGHKGLGGVDWVGVWGDKVLSAGFDGPPVTWTARTGKREADWKFPALPALPDGARGHAGCTWAVSPSGQCSIAARRELGNVPGPLRVMDTSNGTVRLAAEWRGSPGNVAFTKDGHRMFVLDGSGKATWYSLPFCWVERSWDLGGEHHRVLAVSSDGKRVVVHGPYGNAPGAVVLLDGETGRFLAQLNLSGYTPELGFTLSPDGRMAAVAVWEGGLPQHIDLVAMDRWRPVARITHPPESHQDQGQARFSPDGKELAVFFRGGKQLAVYPTPDPDPPVPVLPERWATATGGGPSGTTFVYDPETRRVVIARPGGDAVTILDADTGAKVAAGPTGWKRDTAGSLYVLSQGRLGFRGMTDPAVAVWDLKAGKPADPLSLPPAEKDGKDPRAVWLSPDGRYAAIAGAGTKVVERATGKPLVTVDWPAYSAAFTADSGRVLLAATDGKHRWFDLPSGDPGPAWGTGPVPPALKLRGLNISADGSRIGLLQRAGAPAPLFPAVYDGKTGNVVWEFTVEYIRGLPTVVSADGRLCAALRRPRPDGKIWLDVVETANGRLVGRATFPTREGAPLFFFTADGRGLVVHEGDENKVRWFDLKPGPNPARGPAEGRAPSPR